MSDSQVAKIIMALNHLSSASSVLAAAVNDGGNYSEQINFILNRIKECEDELKKIQFGK